MIAAILLAASVVPADAKSFITGDLKLTDYRAAAADLNHDGSPEVLVLANGPDYCGSGGCALFILTRQARSYRVVTKLSVTRPPIQALPTSSHGWDDLSVTVAGGGIIRPYQAQLRFDGRRYPRNPTVAPAVPAKGKAGRVVIP
ncbi:MAG: hypothetical protein ABW184_02585 [Sphingobium sp.]